MPVPPAGARAEARKGLDWRKEFGRGGTAVGVARARDIANGADLSIDTINRMVSFFARHEVDKQGKGFSPGEDGFPSPGRIAWALWGGDAGRRWAESEQRQAMKKMADDSKTRRPSRLRKLRITRVDRVAEGANPDAHVLLYKRADADNPTNTTPDVVEYVEPDQSADEPLPGLENNQMTAVDRDTLAPEVASLLAEIEAERDAALAKAAEMEQADPEPTDEAEADEEVLKALDPTIRERIAKAETERAELAERIAKMEDEAATASFIAKAAEYKTVDPDAVALGAMLKDVTKNCAAESAQTLSRVLKGAAARLDEANRLITAEIGTAVGMDATDAGQQIEALAKARATETGEALPVATAAVLNDNPHLYEQARAERAV